ncbi:MAG: transposon-transfer assisting family protein [Defluviitaleaceae bacterium]|nr:transposon-transfer assisting family protein [Defluviitaleaceae bacterium]
MKKFTFEELCLIRIFDTTTREALCNELITGLQFVSEPEMASLFASTLEKLEALTDEEFYKL